jgi:prepilin-type N-terminal cleavage/methylation domain-containing protein
MMNRRSALRGFTLLEVLIALMITVAAALLLSNAWSGNLLRVRKATLYNNVAQLLERKIAEIQAKNTKKKFTEIKEEEGDFGSDFPQYRWTFSKQPFVMPDISALLVAQQKDGVDQMLVTVLSKMREIMGKAILEATVTVYVKNGTREIPYAATFYIVDYDSPVNIGM